MFRVSLAGSSVFVQYFELRYDGYGRSQLNLQGPS